jgi:hypothetical protein
MRAKAPIFHTSQPPGYVTLATNILSSKMAETTTKEWKFGI